MSNNFKKSSELCSLLGIKYPIFQGAMAWISEAELASGVSNAGGLGIIAGGNAPPDIIREQIRKAKSLTDKPFAVNIMLLSPYADEVVEVICEEGVKVVTTGAGNPAKYMEKFEEKGVCVIPVVPSVAIAKKMEKIGAKAVIVEGMEAGGHIGKLTTMVLVPQVVDAINIPVISAGGIADGRGYNASFMLGASGVQMGTRFLVAKECNIHENYKNKILKAKDIDTVITGQITGHPVRVLRNKLTRLYDAVEREELKKDEPNVQRIEDLGQGALQKAVQEGDINNGSIMAGQIAGLVNKEQTCEEIIKEILNESAELLKNI
ncbi:MAG: enoyl-[acyl-carrier-protein] reductase FabK [bacterium]